MAEQKPMQNAFARAVLVAGGIFCTISGMALCFPPQLTQTHTEGMDANHRPASYEPHEPGTRAARWRFPPLMDIGTPAGRFKSIVPVVPQPCSRGPVQ